MIHTWLGIFLYKYQHSGLCLYIHNLQDPPRYSVHKKVDLFFKKLEFVNIFFSKTLFFQMLNRDISFRFYYTSINYLRTLIFVNETKNKFFGSDHLGFASLYVFSYHIIKQSVKVWGRIISCLQLFLWTLSHILYFLTLNSV